MRSALREWGRRIRRSAIVRRLRKEAADDRLFLHPLRTGTCGPGPSLSPFIARSSLMITVKRLGSDRRDPLCDASGGGRRMQGPSHERFFCLQVQPALPQALPCGRARFQVLLGGHLRSQSWSDRAACSPHGSNAPAPSSAPFLPSFFHGHSGGPAKTL